MALSHSLSRSYHKLIATLEEQKMKRGNRLHLQCLSIPRLSQYRAFKHKVLCQQVCKFCSKTHLTQIAKSEWGITRLGLTHRLFQISLPIPILWVFRHLRVRFLEALHWLQGSSRFRPTAVWQLWQAPVSTPLSSRVARWPCREELAFDLKTFFIEMRCFRFTCRGHHHLLLDEANSKSKSRITHLSFHRELHKLT